MGGAGWTSVSTGADMVSVVASRKQLESREAPVGDNKGGEGLRVTAQPKLLLLCCGIRCGLSFRLVVSREVLSKPQSPS